MLLDIVYFVVESILYVLYGYCYFSFFRIHGVCRPFSSVEDKSWTKQLLKVTLLFFFLHVFQRKEKRIIVAHTRGNKVERNRGNNNFAIALHPSHCISNLALS